ncbi:nickel/cobalt transporter (NiCoT) family protein [Geosmithia morbida]|uniref:Nickel/cobalt efflux system n=1 Tax=Geosmithia morbida TaxID=1094350 RepID=A0A9P5CXJ9_9HYPO|nr:nickel/cobalt transporter (NiCoT) family protein [Geosmithia morbida]KAF4119358.1 nickel/cobalt transporter (NiCoT) family protein [Geosmithia morbida]
MGTFTFPWPSSLQHLPKNVRVLIGSLIAINALIWLAVATPVMVTHPVLAAPAALSYTLGLRHGLDADHIAAIDLTTRRLIASGQRPASVGTFFSLGHSTVVIITCIVVAATSGALRDRFDGFSRVGNIIGTAVSAVFLIALSIGNAWVLYRLIRRLRKVLASSSNEQDREFGHLDGDDDGAAQRAAGDQFSVEGGGVLTKVFGRLFKAVDRPWKLYPLGFVFGLGFDTSSEIAILGISSIQAAKGTNLWLILIFPVLFTAGMCLVDTTDGGLMLSLYTSKVFSRDPVAILYYSIVLTGITVTVSAFIGIIQVLSLIQNAADPKGRFWDGVGAIGDKFDIIGGSICGLFLLVGIGSVLAYRPWRRYLDRRDAARAEVSREAGIADHLRPSPRERTPLLEGGQ